MTFCDVERVADTTQETMTSLKYVMNAVVDEGARITARHVRDWQIDEIIKMSRNQRVLSPTSAAVATSATSLHPLAQLTRWPQNKHSLASKQSDCLPPYETTHEVSVAGHMLTY